MVVECAAAAAAVDVATGSGAYRMHRLLATSTPAYQLSTGRGRKTVVGIGVSGHTSKVLKSIWQNGHLTPHDSKERDKTLQMERMLATRAHKSIWW